MGRWVLAFTSFFAPFPRPQLREVDLAGATLAGGGGQPGEEKADDKK